MPHANQHSRKGQSGIEAIVLIILVLMFALILQATIGVSREKQSEAIQAELMARTVCNRVAQSINLAAYSGVGFSENISVPRTFLTTTFNISVYSNQVVVSWEKEKISCPTFSDSQLLLNPPRNLSVAYYQKETYMSGAIAPFNPVVYKKSDNDSQFLTDVRKYDFWFIEDPHFSAAMMNATEEYVLGGGWIYISEHLVGSSPSQTLNVTYTHRGKNDGETSTVISIDNHLGLHLGDTYVNEEIPYVTGNFSKLAEYPDKKAAIATWNYGNGTIYYFSDFNADYCCGDYQTTLANGINLTLYYLASLKNTPFSLNQTDYGLQKQGEKIVFIH